MSRIVNIGYRCCGYNFDAAVDCDWELHCYDEKRNDVTPIELYNLDEDWDIRMVYQKIRMTKTNQSMQSIILLLILRTL